MPSITITTNAANSKKLAAAIGGLKQYKDDNDELRAATPAEVKSAVIDLIKDCVFRWERYVAQKEAADALDQIEVS